MLLNVARERLHVVMHERAYQLGRLSRHDEVLVNLHISHRRILVLQPAFIMSLPAAEQRHLPKASAGEMQGAPEKTHLQCDPIAVYVCPFDGPANFLAQPRGEYFVGIQQQNPFVRKRERIHRPLPLLGPTPLIMKLHDSGAV